MPGSVVDTQHRVVCKVLHTSKVKGDKYWSKRLKSEMRGDGQDLQASFKTERKAYLGESDIELLPVSV